MVEEVKFEEAPEEIFSGTILDDQHIFLHVLKRNENYDRLEEDENSEGRVYDIKGKLISKIEIPKFLK